MKLPGVISLRKLLPIWQTPNGILRRVVRWMFLKLTKMPCAVSGRRYTSAAVSSVTPWWVLNMRLNLRISVKSLLPQPGQGICCARMKATISSLVMASTFTSGMGFSASQPSMSLSARWRILQDLQSMSGSLNVVTWPEATQTCGFMRMAESSPTL